VFRDGARAIAPPREGCGSTGFTRPVSGLVTGPSSPAFHLSLTLLSTLSVSAEYLALAGVPLPSRSALGLRYSPMPSRRAYGAGTLYGGAVERTSATSLLALHMPRRVRSGLLPVRSPLLGESLLLSPPGLNDMLKFSPYSPAARVRYPRLSEAPVLGGIAPAA